MSILPALFTDAEMKEKCGNFPTHFSQLIDTDYDAFTPTSEGYKHIFSLRKGVLDEKYQNLALEHLLPIARYAKSSNRGVAAGKVDFSRVHLPKAWKKAVAFERPSAYRSKVVFEDGSLSPYAIGNYTRSLLAGYYDEKGKEGGRETAFLRNHTQKWKNIQPLLQEVDRLYADIHPEGYAFQKQRCAASPYRIPSTVFSTLTINYDYQSGIHCDVGNAEGCTSLLATFGKGWKEGYLCLPQYDVAIDIRPGDLLFFNPFEYHCNMPICGEGRLSMIFYLRESLCDPKNTLSEKS